MGLLANLAVGLEMGGAIQHTNYGFEEVASGMVLRVGFPEKLKRALKPDRNIIRRYTPCHGDGLEVTICGR